MLTNRPVQIDNDHSPGGCVACHHRLRRVPDRTGWDKGATIRTPLHTRWLGIRVPFASCFFAHQQRAEVRGLSYPAQLGPAQTPVVQSPAPVKASNQASTLYPLWRALPRNRTVTGSPRQRAAAYHQFSSPGFCFLHPVSEGKRVVMAKR
jgi:hypothetical protein